MDVLPADTLVHDRYRIVLLMGQGGMGAVYEAVDTRLKRRVALKQLLVTGPQLSHAFTREAQLLANLEHPALPNVSDHFSEALGQFLVMQYIPGDDLAVQQMMRSAPFPLTQVLEWADQLLDVLHYLHSQKPPIVHRDIKPQNIKINARGQLMLLDFGLAKGATAGMSRYTGVGSIMAHTPGYAPPEQMEGTGTDERSDLYAFGATLHRLLTNAPPIGANTRMLAVIRQRADPLLPAHQLNSEVPEAISHVLSQAMALEPDERPQSAATMLALLNTARSRQISVGDPSSAPKAAPPTITHPVANAAPPPVPLLTTNALSATTVRQEFDQTALSQVAPDGAVAQKKIDAVGQAATTTLVNGHHRSRQGFWATVGAVVVLAVLLSLLVRRNTIAGGTPTSSPASVMPASSVIVVVANTPLPPSATSVPTPAPASPSETAMATVALSPTVTPMPEPSPTDPPSPTQLPDAVVSRERLLLRQGPSTAHTAIATYAEGTPIHLLGKDTSGTWVQVQGPDGLIGWMFGEYLQFNRSIAELVIVAAPPAPTPVPTKAPTAVPTRVVVAPPRGVAKPSPRPRPSYTISGAVSVNEGVPIVGEPGSVVAVPVAFQAASNGGTVSQMRVITGPQCVSEASLATTSWAPWQAMRSFSVTMAVGRSLFSVSVQYRDAQGNVSKVYCADVLLDGEYRD